MLKNTDYWPSNVSKELWPFKKNFLSCPPKVMTSFYPKVFENDKDELVFSRESAAIWLMRGKRSN